MHVYVAVTASQVHQPDDAGVDIATDHVRPATEQDLEAVNDIYNHYVRTSHVTFDVYPTSMDWRRRWFEEHDGPHRIFVALFDGRVIGYARSGRYRPKAAYETTVETSVYVAPDCVGRAVGTSLYAVLLDALGREDVHRALAGIAQPNEASVTLHRRFGFEFVAHFSEQGRKFDHYWDVDWFERALG